MRISRNEILRIIDTKTPEPAIGQPRRVGDSVFDLLPVGDSKIGEVKPVHVTSQQHRLTVARIVQ